MSEYGLFGPGSFLDVHSQQTCLQSLCVVFIPNVYTQSRVPVCKKMVKILHFFTANSNMLQNNNAYLMTYTASVDETNRVCRDEMFIPSG